MNDELTGDEIESVDELSEGDRITIIKDSEYQIENTGTAYKIPDGWTETDVVKVDGAVVDNITTGIGGIPEVRMSDCSDAEQSRADLVPDWCEADDVTVIRHEVDET